MKELITQRQADLLFGLLLVVGLIAGPLAAFLARRHGGDALRAALLFGGPLTLVGVLWRVYNAITNRLGLDSVLNLVVNLALFIVIGGLCGVVGARLFGVRQDSGDLTESAETT